MLKPILIILTTAAMLPFIALADDGGQCDGRQMYNYVDTALSSGSGVVNAANDPLYGAGAVTLALRSSNMEIYNAMSVSIREHDLYLARMGCKSLSGGPTKGMMSSLRQVDAKIGKLINSQYSQKGVLTDGFGSVR